MKRTSELTNSCLQLLRANGAKAWRNQTVGVFDKDRGIYRTNREREGVGAPDILCCLNGHFVACEVKVGKDKLNANQIKWRDSFIAAGGSHIVVTDNVDNLLSWLKEYQGTK